MKKQDTYPELTEIVRGSTYKKFFDWLYKAAQLRYTTKDHLNRLNHQFGTKKKLASLKEAGFFTAIKNGDVYVITKKARKVLSDEGYNTAILQDDFNGFSINHELKVTDCLIHLEPNDVFYYDFGYVRPDAIMIFKEPHRYKIVFLEVESEKGNWDLYLNDKKLKYMKLAEDPDIYSKWWKVMCEKLKLPYPEINQFCFWITAFVNKNGEWSGFGLFEGRV